jgi:hypothetical protein
MKMKYGLYIPKTEDSKRIKTIKNNQQVKELALLQCQSQDAKAKIHRGLTQIQQVLQLLFVLK